jgi:type IV secretory pathway TrbD component
MGRAPARPIVHSRDYPDQSCDLFRWAFRRILPVVWHGRAQTIDSISFTFSSARHPRRLALVAGIAVGAFLFVVPNLASAKSFHLKIRSAAAARTAAKQDPNRGTLNVAARRAIHRGYLVPNQARYDLQKARSTRRAASREALTGPVSAPLAPSIISGRSWQGINSRHAAPPDETSAVGTTRYIELVNTKFAIYNKTSNSPISSGSINSLAGVSPTDSVFDVQVIWDPTTSRFYYGADDVVSSLDNNLAFGFSKTASPNSAADWCKYAVPFGAVFPDYPKLGDSRFFAIFGSNLFDSGGSLLGSDLLAISKPPAGPGCPAASSFKLDDAAPLMMDASTPAFSPVAANEIDTKGTGWAVARSQPLPATQLSLFKVTKDATTGDPVIQSTGTPVTVPGYAAPPNAPQKGSVNKIDTLDARLTQAVAALDPAHSNSFAIWTQHAIDVGGRAAIRWYEIDTGANSPLQSGTASNASRFLFNGAISPNRRLNGTTKTGGNAMVLNYDSSSSATFPGIRIVSKFATGAQSAPVVVKNSPGPVSGFDCDAATQTCRWGDYAAATPDPSAANRVWQVSQFAVGSGSGTSGPATSRTWNFVAIP